MVATTVAPMALAQALLAAAQGFSAQAQVLLALAQILVLQAQDQPTPRGPARRRRRRRSGALGAASPSEESNSPQVHFSIATPGWSDASAVEETPVSVLAARRWR